MNSIQKIASSLLQHRGIIAQAFPTLGLQSSPFSFDQQHSQVRSFASKYISKSAKKRLPMTTKRAGKGFYKGNGATKEGKLNTKGKFVVDPRRQLQLVVPDLEGFALKPYIASTASKHPPETRRRPGQVA
jgi:large subunit ribosomal protein L41